jgi:hypothetical protein
MKSRTIRLNLSGFSMKHEVIPALVLLEDLDLRAGVGKDQIVERPNQQDQPQDECGARYRDDLVRGNDQYRDADRIQHGIASG